MTTKERWKPVCGFEKIYHISNFGRVKRVIDCIGSRSGHILTPCVNKNGYMNYNLRKNNKAYTVRGHKIAMISFVGPYPKGKEINHIDGDKTNNAISNLEYVTKTQNMRHAIKNGFRTLQHGNSSPHHKLMQQDVALIKECINHGLSAAGIAALFGVSGTAIRNIKHGKTWNH